MAPPATPVAEGVVTKPSPYSVGETMTRLLLLLEKKGLTLFAVIDHSGAAEAVGLDMPDTKLVVFGSPAAGTPVMLASPLAALDLPLKLLIWTDPNPATGTGSGVSVSYTTAGYLATRHHLSDELRARLEAIDAVSDATVAVDQ